MQHAGQLPLFPNDPKELQATLQQSVNTAALASQAPVGMPHALHGPRFEAAAISGVTFLNACGEGVAAFENCCKKKTRSHDPESRQGRLT